MMEVIQARKCIGSDGVLRLEIPTTWCGRDVEVCVVLNPLPSSTEDVPSEVRNGYPEGYFESVIGKWEGDFERPAQGVAEERDPLP